MSDDRIFGTRAPEETVRAKLVRDFGAARAAKCVLKPVLETHTSMARKVYATRAWGVFVNATDPVWADVKIGHAPAPDGLVCSWVIRTHGANSLHKNFYFWDTVYLEGAL